MKMARHTQSRLGMRLAQHHRTHRSRQHHRVLGRETLAALYPSSAALERILQWVAAAGLLCVVSSTSRATSIFNGAHHGGRSHSISGESVLGIAFAPARDRHPPEAQLRRNRLVLFTRGHQQNDTGALHQPDADELGANQPGELDTLILAQHRGGATRTPSLRRPRREATDRQLIGSSKILISAEPQRAILLKPR
jgi:hypothetical protein